MAEDVNPVADVLLEFTQALIHHVITARGAYADDGSRSTVYGVRLRAPPASRRVEVERFLEDCLSTLRAPLSRCARESERERERESVETDHVRRSIAASCGECASCLREMVDASSLSRSTFC